ncbi:MAG: hypothetical protein Q7S74_06555 [Nanoarchaeota archaeon]|nr:hypothetical protein [Nanoarchaeota archaeon]
MADKSIDFKFFYKLSSLYEALTLSACDPVVVPSGIGSKGLHVFSHMFYDCMEDEEEGFRIMEDRKRIAQEDIVNHFSFHEYAVKAFYSIDELANVNNREGVVNIARELAIQLEQYSGFTGIITEHKTRLEKKAFLNYPVCFRGHYFQVPWYTNLAEKSFNPTISESGVITEAIKTRYLGNQFLTVQGPIPKITISEGKDSGEGLIDTSLRGRLELTKELLRRAGFKIKLD